MVQKVSELMTPAPVSLRSGQSAAEAAEAMRDHGIGDVLVVDDGQLTGLITDRDIVVRAIADGRDPGQTAVADVCSAELITAGPNDDADIVVQRMRERGVRRIPVVDDGHPVGVLSIGDLAIERDERSVLADISAKPPNT